MEPVAFAVESLTRFAEASAPMLGALLLSGLVIGIAQAVTQVNDPAVGFVPRLAVALLVTALLGPWMLEQSAAHLAQALDLIGKG